MYRDKWIMNLSSYKLDFDGDEQFVPCMVSSLLHQEDNSWNYDIVEQLFDWDVAQAIFRASISRFCSKDRLVWTSSFTSSFSVKSTYIIAQSFHNKEVSSTSNRRRIWSLIWSAKVALRLKYFFWRVVHNTLPTAIVFNIRVFAPVEVPWIPPPEGVVKINMDAAWNVNDHCAVMAAIARDHADHVL
ncbi:hypothetical protein PTKIN_Ptkin04bG0081300 [Pterospermum kingtungense]